MMGDFEVKLTGGYRLERESPHKIDVYHQSGGKEVGIPAKVVEIAWNERFHFGKATRIATPWRLSRGPPSCAGSGKVQLLDH